MKDTEKLLKIVSESEELFKKFDHRVKQAVDKGWDGLSMPKLTKFKETLSKTLNSEVH